MHSLKKLALLAVTATFVAASSAVAAPSAWDMPAGDQGTYTYSNGQNETNEFESGTAFEDGFFFLPADFTATSNSSPTTSDTLSVILNAKPNQSFTRISSNLLGDYTIFGGGTVNSTGELRVTNLDTSMTLTSPLSFGGTVPVATASSADGIFQGMTALDLPEGWTNIRVEMDGALFAGSGNGSALIQIKDAELGIGTAEIPLPGAAFVAPIAAYFGWRAKRKFMSAR